MKFKKGQGELVAFVLLIGFTVVIGIMVGSWAIQHARKTSTTLVERGEIDVRCADVAIVAGCDTSNNLEIINKGYFTITKLKVSNIDKTVQNFFPNQAISAAQIGIGAINLNTPVTIIPFIKIEGKDTGCSNKAITLDVNPCV